MEEDNTVDYRIDNVDDLIVVCKDCRSIQDSDRVMNSSWYNSGILPPCRCGGPTMEIPRNKYDDFIISSKKGKRFL